MRLTYLDEAGVDHGAPVLCVAGVIVHGDRQWPEVDRRISAIIEEYIPVQDRPGFTFHSKDVFHGSGYFDRRKPEWANYTEKRMPILNALAAIIADLNLPVVTGTYTKETFGIGELPSSMSSNQKARFIHQIAALDCLIWTDRWLGRFAPNELATIVHEEGDSAKRVIKRAVNIFTDDRLLAQSGLPADTREKFGLPLKRVIDTVHFAAKADARPLQLADLCAFTIGRSAKNKPVPESVVAAILPRLAWLFEWSQATSTA